MKGEVQHINGKRVATTEYRSWQMMKNRVLNLRAKDYPYYGGRGIKIIRRWLVYDHFLADMGRKPAPLLTLERRNVNGNYSKRNCFWATRQQQARNRNYCKLTLTSAERIRRLYADGKGDQYELAAQFGVTQPLVSQIIRNVSWRREVEGTR